MDADLYEERGVTRYGELEDIVGGRIVGIDEDDWIIVEVEEES